jgi:hypothetical protein
VLLTAVKVPLVALATVMASAEKPVTSSEKVRVKVTSWPILAMPLLLSEIAMVGDTVSIVTEAVLEVMGPIFPA